MANKLPRIVNDNVPGLMQAAGKTGTFRTVRDDKEFFDLLKEKLLNDIDNFYGATDNTKRATFLADMMQDYWEYLEYLEGTMTMNGLGEITDARKKRLGGFTKKLVLEKITDDKKETNDKGD